MFFEKSHFVKDQDALLYQINIGHCRAIGRRYNLEPVTDQFGEEIGKIWGTQPGMIDDPEGY